MSEFTDQYFRDLPPRDRRYDTPVADQLVFCVFPNGIKAWVHIYPFEGFTRRRTVGLFPAMSYQEAMEALGHSQLIVDTEHTHARRRSDPGVSAAIRRVLVYFAIAMAAALITALLIHSIQDDDPPTAETVATDADSNEPPAQSAPDPFVPQSETSEEPNAGIDLPTAAPPEVEPLIETNDPGDQERHPDSLETEPDKEAASPSPVADADPVPVQPESPSPAASEESDEEVTAPESDAPNAAESTESSAETSASTSKVPDDAVAIDETDPDEEPDVERDRDPQRNGLVSRALLTSGMAGREPVDVLPASVSVPEGGVRTIYFFTELRQLGGHRVVHRWQHGAETVAKVPFRIGANSRWRVYSSKEIAADRPGQWAVTVVSDDGEVLASASFMVDALTGQAGDETDGDRQ